MGEIVAVSTVTGETNPKRKATLAFRLYGNAPPPPAHSRDSSSLRDLPQRIRGS
jgi:hypothetical protein